MRARVVNLGCKVNRCESDSFERTLMSRGYDLDSPSGLDLVIVNTCTVTSAAEKKTRKAVRRALKDNPHAKVVVTGCAAQMSPDVFRDMSARVDVVEKWNMEEALRALAGGHRGDALHAPPRYRTRVGVKVQDGCGNDCAYCIVHKLRGPEVSTSKDKVVSDIADLLYAGIGEVMITGINLARYHDGGTDLTGLLRYISDQERAGVLPESRTRPKDGSPARLNWRLRLSSMEPDDVDSGLIREVAESDGRICRHFHLPLQAGSDKVLREMGRRYSKDSFFDLVKEIRRLIPAASISTDVIVGFPGETESEFLETVEYCRQCGFSKMHIFPYSARAGTPAAERPDQIPEDEKAARSRYLRDIASELRQKDRDMRDGSKEFAVVESAFDATTESYHYVRSPYGARIGELAEVIM